jgi:hypothetical protein
VTPPTRRSVSLVPPQHGAWAFLGLPLVVGIAVASWTPVLLALAAAWITAYPLSYFVLALAKDSTSRHPHPERWARPLVVWGIITVPLLLALVLLRPWLVWPGLVYTAGFLVNVAFARRRDDRALVNDIVFIAECTLVVPLAWAIGSTGRTWALPDFASAPKSTWILTIAVALLLTGSTLHVKSLIRERANPAFARVSRSFAVASLVVAVGLAAMWGLPSGLFLVLPFAWMAGRSFIVNGSSAPSRIGMIELVGFLLLGLPALVLVPS